MSIVIEKGIPMPPVRSANSVPGILDEMNAGDSAVIEKRKSFTWYQAALRAGVRITIRPLSKTKSRVWLVSKTK